MKKVELCAHNLKAEAVLRAVGELEVALAGKAELERVSCIGDCGACHSGVLIARVEGQIITDTDSSSVIAKVVELIG